MYSIVGVLVSWCNGVSLYQGLGLLMCWCVGVRVYPSIGGSAIGVWYGMFVYWWHVAVCVFA